MSTKVVSGKSPYATGSSSQRSRGWMLVVTVIILGLAAVAWITNYTRAVAVSPTTEVSGKAMDPNGHAVDSTTKALDAPAAGTK